MGPGMNKTVLILLFINIKISHINHSNQHVGLQVDGTLKAKSGNNSANGIDGWPQIAPLSNYGNSRDGPYLQYQAFIYAVNVSDISIIGSGTIDGQVAKCFIVDNACFSSSGGCSLVLLVIYLL